MRVRVFAFGEGVSMKKALSTLVAVFFLFIPALSFPAYKLHLRDGREILTDEYWEEGDEIKFRRFGGVLGIQKDLIRKIEETEDLNHKKEKSTKTELQKDTEGCTEKASVQENGECEPKAQSEKEKTTSSEQETKTDPPSSKKKDKSANPLLQEFQRLKEKSKHFEAMSTEELYQFDKDLLDLRNKILKAGLAGPYENQLIEILSMGNKMEQILNERNQ